MVRRRLFRCVTLLLTVPLFAAGIAPQLGLSAEDDCDPKYLSQASALTSAVTVSEEVDILQEPPIMLDSSSAGLGEPDAALLAAQEALVSATVKTYVHVIQGDPLPVGYLPIEVINLQMDILNSAYSATPFRFELVDVTWTSNQAWFNLTQGSAEERAMKTALRVGDQQTLNIYTTGSQEGSWATFPSSYRSDPKMDGVVNQWTTVPGDTAVHEVGHWLGLWHTFENGCEGVGDEVADTPAHLRPVGLPDNLCGDPESGFDTCPAPGTDPVHNYMNYSSDPCWTEFTVGQDTRMQQMWSAYRVPAPTKVKGKPPGKGKR
jgi:hypothetical protein